MKPYELFQFSHLAQLLQDVASIISRYQRDELPAILEDECHNDPHRQLLLPLPDPDDPDRHYFDSRYSRPPDPWEDF